MSNHNESQNHFTFLGSSTGPIDELFENWLNKIGAENGFDKFNETQLAWVKFVYFTASCDVYNILMTVIKGDHSLKSLQVLSEAMRLNINNYIQSLPANKSN